MENRSDFSRKVYTAKPVVFGYIPTECEFCHAKLRRMGILAKSTLVDLPRNVIPKHENGKSIRFFKKSLYSKTCCVWVYNLYKVSTLINLNPNSEATFQDK